jgi:hypothetical protein
MIILSKLVFPERLTMKTLYQTIFFIVFFMHQLPANNLTIVNSTAGQVSVTVKTTQQSVTESAKPDENQFLNDINNPESTSTQLSYDNNPLDKIIIVRVSTNIPQIIYYNQETSVDDNKNPSGLFKLNISGQGTLRVWQDKISINNAFYQLLDISSIITRCNLLKSSLTTENLDAIQKEIDDLNESIKLIQESDKGSQLGGQIAITQTAIMILKNEVQIIKTLNTMVQTVQNLQDHLADDNATETDNQLQGIAIGLRTVETAQTLQHMQSGAKTLEVGLQSLSQSIAHGPVMNQIQKIKNAMNKLKLAIQQKQNSQATINPEELISPQQQVNDEIAINNMQAMNNTGMGYNN